MSVEELLLQIDNEPENILIYKSLAEKVIKSIEYYENELERVETLVHEQDWEISELKQNLIKIKDIAGEHV